MFLYKMGKYGSKLSIRTLTILKEKTCLCSNQLKDNENTNETFTEIINEKSNNEKTNEIVWELEEVDYSCDPIYI
jgi:hypothetical protein